MKTMVAIPCMDTVQTEFADSLLKLRPKGLMMHCFMPCSLIYKSRNDLGQLAIREKTDYVLWVDSDMVFPSDTLIDLMADLEEGRDIVAATCHMRRPPFRPVFYKKLRMGITPAENEHENWDDYPKDGPFKLEAVGFGCVLMRTSVLETVINKYGDLFAPLPGFGEELSFCIRARGCGYDIWADPRVQVGHKASTIVTKETFEAFRRATEHAEGVQAGAEDHD